MRRVRYWRRLKADLVVSSAADIPDRLPVRHAMVVGRAGHMKWLTFDCPCRRGHRVMLNLDAGNSPRWRVSETYPLTLRPSVDELSHLGRCHYVVDNGRVHWVERTAPR